MSYVESAIRELVDGPELSYDSIVATFGYDYELAATFGSYQGDYVYVLKDGDRRGMLVVGYGSCSGCDLLESLSWDLRYSDLDEAKDAAVDELAEYAERLYGEIRWFDTQETFNAWIQDELDKDADIRSWYWYESEFEEWAKGYLGQYA